VLAEEAKVKAGGTQTQQQKAQKLQEAYRTLEEQLNEAVKEKQVVYLQ
jgi:hypothetical protein